MNFKKICSVLKLPSDLPAGMLIMQLLLYIGHVGMFNILHWLQGLLTEYLHAKYIQDQEFTYLHRIVNDVRIKKLTCLDYFMNILFGKGYEI